MTPKIIGLCGYAGSGKDTLARILCDDCGFVQVSFADKVREVLMHLDPFLPEAGAYVSDLVEKEGYECAKRRYLSFRKWLVKIGHGMRTIVNDRVWIDAADLSTKIADGKTMVVVSDVRYANEAATIRDLGGKVWYIFRPGCDAATPEEKDSITMIRNFDAVITNSGMIDDLRATVREMLQ